MSNEEIVRAIERDNAEEVSRLLDHNPELLEEDDDDEVRPLMVAAAFGHVGLLSTLLGKGADVHACNVDENTALHLAARRGHVGAVEVLLDNGANIRCRNAWNETPLSFAAEEGHLATVAHLLSRADVKVDAMSYEGETPLVCACLRGQHDVARLLLRSGADPSYATKTEGLTATTLVPLVPGRDRCMNLVRWWKGELERHAALSRARCLSLLDTLKPTTSDANLPTCLRARLMCGVPLPSVEVRGTPGQQEQGGKAGKRPMQEGDGGRGETTRAVANYVVSELNQDLFTELMEGMKPY